jgi:hypothetical protein
LSETLPNIFGGYVKDLKLDVRLASVLAVVVSACGTSYTSSPRTATISVATDVGNIKNDGTKANVTVTTADAAGKAGTGTVTLTAPYGDVAASGTPTATLTLDASGVAKTTYACNVASEPRCLTASVTLTATWSAQAVSNAALLTVLAPSGTGTDAGGPPPPPPGDGGVTGVSSVAFAGVFPAYVIVSTAANTALNLPGTATATFSVTQGGTAVAGTTVTFAEKQGETLVTLGAPWSTTDASGNVTVTLTGKTTIGLAHITASLATGTPAVMTLPVLGAPTSIIVTAVVPSLLGLKGSGIQETGLMSFLVTDSFGSPIPGVTVNFTQAQPALVTFSHSSAVTDDAGKVVADYSAGPEVGVSTISATVVAPPGASASHAIAVRGAKPSGSGFNFHCDRGNLPVYTTTSFFEKTVCTVRLSDRYGNRVGISTPVSFAAEAGSISASATTKAFDFGSPTDPDEGSVSVTFSSDLGNGFSPADVAPLAAAPTQFPIPRFNAEPSSTNGQLIFNPRDQFVTIIAMVRGEEAFVDANHNGQFDPGEMFVDQGDPFIDANDNNQYDAATEPRFCGGASCATYNGPNGVWDSDRTIWAPTWVVFSDTPSAIADPWAPGSCVDYTDNNAANSTTAISSAKMVDRWLNTGALGTTYGATLNASLTPPTLTISGGFAEQDGWGSVGLLHFNFDWVRVSAADNTKACAIANGSACVERLVFGDFDPGYRITATVTDTNKVPTPTPGAGAGHACPPTPTAGTRVSSFTVTFKGTTGGSFSNVNSPAGTYAN